MTGLEATANPPESLTMWPFVSSGTQGSQQTDRCDSSQGREKAQLIDSERTLREQMKILQDQLRCVENRCADSFELVVLTRS